jgi:transcriptional regulator with XRE-family HTH domain
MNPFELVRALRAKGLTQKEIEARTGISQPTVSKIERGEITDVMSRYYRTLLAAYEEVMKAEEGASAASPDAQGQAPPPPSGRSSRPGAAVKGGKIIRRR